MNNRVRLVLIFPLLLFVASWVAAQVTPVPRVVSPEVLADRRVVFRMFAPKAQEVGLMGDWMMPGTRFPMVRDETGVWSVTTGPLEPGLAIYSFFMDGVILPDPVNPRIKLRARTSASLVDVPGDPPELWQARDVPHGSVEVNWFKSEVTRDTRSFLVYTPPNYDSRGSRRYPVLYLLHGNNDTASGWTDVGRANFIFDNLIHLKKSVPMIVVMPWGHAVPYDGPQTNNTALFEKQLLSEILPGVESKYRVSTRREHRAIVGLSMGGGHAIQIGLGHLELFSAVAAFSSAIPGDFERKFQGFLSNPETANRMLKLLWVGCGRQDAAFERNQAFTGMLSSHGIRCVFVPSEGLHNFAIWRRHLVEVAPLLFK